MLNSGIIRPYSLDELATKPERFVMAIREFRGVQNEIRAAEAQAAR